MAKFTAVEIRDMLKNGSLTVADLEYNDVVSAADSFRKQNDGESFVSVYNGMIFEVTRLTAPESQENNALRIPADQRVFSDSQLNQMPDMIQYLEDIKIQGQQPDFSAEKTALEARVKQRLQDIKDGKETEISPLSIDDLRAMAARAGIDISNELEAALAKYAQEQGIDNISKEQLEANHVVLAEMASHLDFANDQDLELTKNISNGLDVAKNPEEPNASEEKDRELFREAAVNSAFAQLLTSGDFSAQVEEYNNEQDKTRKASLKEKLVALFKKEINAQAEASAYTMLLQNAVVAAEKKKKQLLTQEEINQVAENVNQDMDKLSRGEKVSISFDAFMGIMAEKSAAWDERTAYLSKKFVDSVIPKQMQTRFSVWNQKMEQNHPKSWKLFKAAAVILKKASPALALGGAAMLSAGTMMAVPAATAYGVYRIARGFKPLLKKFREDRKENPDVKFKETLKNNKIMTGRALLSVISGSLGLAASAYSAFADTAEAVDDVADTAANTAEAAGNVADTSANTAEAAGNVAEEGAKTDSFFALTNNARLGVAISGATLSGASAVNVLTDKKASKGRKWAESIAATVSGVLAVWGITKAVSADDVTPDDAAGTNGGNDQPQENVAGSNSTTGDNVNNNDTDSAEDTWVEQDEVMAKLKAYNTEHEMNNSAKYSWWSTRTPEDLENQYNNLDDDTMKTYFPGMSREEVLMKYNRLDAWTARVKVLANGDLVPLPNATRFHAHEELKMLKKIIECGEHPDASEAKAAIDYMNTHITANGDTDLPGMRNGNRIDTIKNPDCNEANEAYGKGVSTPKPRQLPAEPEKDQTPSADNKPDRKTPLVEVTSNPTMPVKLKTPDLHIKAPEVPEVPYEPSDNVIVHIANYGNSFHYAGQLTDVEPQFDGKGHITNVEEVFNTQGANDQTMWLVRNEVTGKMDAYMLQDGKTPSVAYSDDPRYFGRLAGVEYKKDLFRKDHQAVWVDENGDMHRTGVNSKSRAFSEIFEDMKSKGLVGDKGNPVNPLIQRNIDAMKSR